MSSTDPRRPTRRRFATVRNTNAGTERFSPEEAVDQKGGDTCRLDRSASAPQRFCLSDGRVTPKPVDDQHTPKITEG